MMQWNRSIRLIAVVSVLAVMLTACGGKAKETDSSAAGQGGAATAAESSNSPAAGNGDSQDVSSTSAGTSDSGTGTADAAADQGKIGFDSTLEELQEKYADRLGYIRVPLSDHPVRRVSQNDAKNINIANYSDAVVDMNTGIPIHSDSQRLIDDAFPFFTTAQAPDVSYVTWEEATNLERAMVKTLFISREGLLLTEKAMNDKDYASSSFRDSMNFFETAAKFDSMAPVAQHPYDITLSEHYDKARQAWGRLAAIDPEQDETAFAETYKEARTATNNAMGLLNILLSTNEQERLENALAEQEDTATP